MKQLVLLALSVLLLAPSAGIPQRGGGGLYVIAGGFNSDRDDNFYVAPTWDGLGLTNSLWFGVPVPASGVMEQLCVHVKTLPPLFKTRSYFVRLDQTNTALSCTISNSTSDNRCCSTGAVNVTAGQQLDIYTSATSSDHFQNETSYSILVRR